MKFLKAALVSLALFSAFIPAQAQIPGMRAGVTAVTSPPWAVTDLSANIKARWVAAPGNVTLSGSNVTSWADISGQGRTATAVSTGPVYSATARNGKPGLVFSGNTAERLSFTVTGLPVGASQGTIAVVGYTTVAGLSTNLTARSQEFDNSYWTKTGLTVTADQCANPLDSTVNADRITNNTSTSAHSLSAGTAGMYLSGSTYAISLYVQAGTASYIQLTGSSGNAVFSGTDQYANFDIATGVVGTKGAGVTTSSISSLGSGWYRLEMVMPAAATAQGTWLYSIQSSASAGRNASYLGASETACVFGAQAELGTSATTYVPTSTAPAPQIAIGYGGSSTNGDSRQVRVDSAGYPRLDLTGITNPVNTSFTTSQWNSTDAIFIAEVGPNQTTKLSMNGDGTYPSLQSQSVLNTTSSTGRIGSTTSSASGWQGVIHEIIVFDRVLTQLEKDKLASTLARTWGSTSIIPSDNPYKNVPATVAATLSSDILSGYVRKWYEPFTSLSLRTGNKYITNASGYTIGKGTWAPAGLNYMTDNSGYGDFGFGVFLRTQADFNYRAWDANFPYLGMLDIGPNGAEIQGSGDYPGVRSNLFKYRGTNNMYLSSLISSNFSVKIKAPYARRTVWSVNATNPNDFEAVWGLGNLYAGTTTATGSMAGNVVTITAVTDSPPNDVAIGLDFSATSQPSPALSNATPSFNTISTLGTGSGGAGTYNMDFSLPTNYTASMAGNVLTVTSLPAGGWNGFQEIKVGQTITCSGCTNVRVTAQLTGSSGNVGTYSHDGAAQTVSSTLMSNIIPAGSSFNIARRHFEYDDYEYFGNVYPTSNYNTTMHVYSRSYQVANPSSDGLTGGPALGTGRFNAGTAVIPGILNESVIIHQPDRILSYLNGILVVNIEVPADSDPGRQDLHHTILNFAMGLSFQNYPGALNGTISGTTLTTSNQGNSNIAIGKSITGVGVAANTIITGGSGTSWTVNNSQSVGPVTMYISPVYDVPPVMTVRSVEILAPASNTSGVFPPTPPSPTITWAGCCSGGNVPLGTTGTVATLSGATNYQLMDFSGVVSGLSISGSNVTATGLTVGQYDFYIRGCAADGSTCNNTLATDGTSGTIKSTMIVPSAVTFNASDCSASGCGLSGGNLTVTNPNVAAWYGARANTAVPAASKVCMEFATTGITGNIAIGVGTNALNLNSAGLSGPGDSIAYYWNDQAYSSLGPQTTLMSAGNPNGTIIRLCINTTSNKAWYTVGNSNLWNKGLGGFQDPASDSGGFSISTFANVYPFALAYGGGVGNGLTANFGATPFTYKLPPGFKTY